MSAHELRLQLADVIRSAQTMQAAIDEGRCPCVADARILRGQAQCAEHLVEIAYVAGLREVAERTPAEDKAAQRYVGLEKLEAERGWTEQSRWDSERLEAARGEAGLTALLDDSASVANSDRDHRSSAAE